MDLNDKPDYVVSNWNYPYPDVNDQISSIGAFILEEASIIPSRSGAASFATRYYLEPAEQVASLHPPVIDFGSYPDFGTTRYFGSEPENLGPLHVGFEVSPVLNPNIPYPSGLQQHIGFSANYSDWNGTMNGRAAYLLVMAGKLKIALVFCKEIRLSLTCNAFAESPTSFGGDTWLIFCLGESLNINKPTDMVDIIQGGLRIRNSKLVQPTSDGNVGQLGWDQFGLLATLVVAGNVLRCLSLQLL